MKKKAIFAITKKAMRITLTQLFFLILFSYVSFATTGKAQSLLDAEISIKANQKEIKTILSKLQQNYSIPFIYSPDAIKADRKVSLDVQNQKLSYFLEKMLQPLGISYKVINEKILLYDPENREIISSDQVNSAMALAVTVKGKVTDENNEPLPGVSVLVKGTTSGTSTDVNGSFQLLLPDNASILVFSFIGYVKQEIELNNREVINVQLLPDAKSLEEVVVTALGISREKRGLVSAVTVVKGSEFTQARENNIANALIGKVAGVDVSGMSSGPGGSSRVVIRGNGSLNGNNQPLYVINGMPMSNNHQEIGVGSGTSKLDQGDGISAINPNDIETISVLKGGAAAALYGSQAANGVILITTKKGKAQQGIGIELNSNFTVGTPAMYPDFQYEYGQGIGSSKPQTQAEALASGRLSFGAKMDGEPSIQFDGVKRPYSAVHAKDNWKNFYNPSTNLTNNIAFSGSSSPALVYRFSLFDLRATSLQPKSTFNRRTANLNLGSQLGKRFKIEANFQYNFDKGFQRPGNGYADNSVSFTTNTLANTVDIRNLAPGYDINGNEVQWNGNPVTDNPYHVINKQGNADSKSRFMGQGSIQYNILDNLFIKVSGIRDIDRFESMSYQPIGTTYYPKGIFNSGSTFLTETSGQAILNYNASFLKDFQINTLAGGTLQKNTFSSNTLSGSEFIVPNFISFNNLALQNTAIGFNQGGQHSVFGAVDLNYKKFLYLSLTGRNDWFSVLNPGNNSIFYPSIGTSFILSDLLKLPEAISYVKLRASWAEVGSATVNPYQVNTSYNFLSGGFLGTPVQTASSSLSNSNLKPLTSKNYEFGMNIEFLNNRLGIDMTYYNRQTTDDILPVPLASSSGYTSALLNIGALSNNGVELLLTGMPVNNNKFTWDVSFNASYNKSEILKLAPGVSSINGSRVGDPYNSILSTTYVTNDKGQRVYNRLSNYEVKGPLQYAGTGVPPYIMGLNNSFRYKNFSLNIQVDGKFGSSVISLLSQYTYRFGVSKKTLPGRDNGLVLSGVDQAGAPYTYTWPTSLIDRYYNTEAGISPITTTLVDASFIRLRSGILSYTIPASKLKFAKIQSASLSLVSRNIAFLYKKSTEFDPESVYSVGNNQANSSNTIPKTRDIGLDLIIKF